MDDEAAIRQQYGIRQYAKPARVIVAVLSALVLLLFGLVMVFSVQSVTVAAQGQDAFTEADLAGLAALQEAACA